jgi:hypothetical protein
MMSPKTLSIIKLVSSVLIVITISATAYLVFRGISLSVDKECDSNPDLLWNDDTKRCEPKCGEGSNKGLSFLHPKTNTCGLCDPNILEITLENGKKACKATCGPNTKYVASDNNCITVCGNDNEKICGSGSAANCYTESGDESCIDGKVCSQGATGAGYTDGEPCGEFCCSLDSTGGCDHDTKKCRPITTDDCSADETECPKTSNGNHICCKTETHSCCNNGDKTMCCDKKTQDCCKWSDKDHPATVSCCEAKETCHPDAGCCLDDNWASKDNECCDGPSCNGKCCNNSVCINIENKTPCDMNDQSGCACMTKCDVNSCEKGSVSKSDSTGVVYCPITDASKDASFCACSIDPDGKTTQYGCMSNGCKWTIEDNQPNFDGQSASDTPYCLYNPDNQPNTLGGGSIIGCYDKSLKNIENSTSGSIKRKATGNECTAGDCFAKSSDLGTQYVEWDDPYCTETRNCALTLPLCSTTPIADWCPFASDFSRCCPNGMICPSDSSCIIDSASPDYNMCTFSLHGDTFNFNPSTALPTTYTKDTTQAPAPQWIQLDDRAGAVLAPAAGSGAPDNYRSMFWWNALQGDSGATTPTPFPIPGSPVVYQGQGVPFAINMQLTPVNAYYNSGIITVIMSQVLSTTAIAQVSLKLPITQYYEGKPCASCDNTITYTTSAFRVFMPAFPSNSLYITLGTSVWTATLPPFALAPNLQPTSGMSIMFDSGNIIPWKVMVVELDKSTTPVDCPIKLVVGDGTLPTVDPKVVAPLTIGENTQDTISVTQTIGTTSYSMKRWGEYLREPYTIGLIQLWHNLGWSSSVNQKYLTDSVGVTMYDRYGANNELKSIYTNSIVNVGSLAHKNLTMYFPMIYPDYDLDAWATMKAGKTPAVFPVWLQDTGSVSYKLGGSEKFEVSEKFGVTEKFGASSNVRSHRTLIIVAFSIIGVATVALIMLYIHHKFKAKLSSTITY